MTHRLDVARGRDIVARWCNLAEQRLEYLTELFETGRWRRFHSERAFLENIQEAKAAVETLARSVDARGLAATIPPSISPGSAGAGATLPRSETLPDQARRFQWQPAPNRGRTAAIRIVSISPETVHVPSEEAPSAPESAQRHWTSPRTCRRTSPRCSERYPLLRNAL